MGLRIALDGPAGAGKSTIAKAVAGRLSILYVDTGALYRTLALMLIRQGIDGQDREKVEQACLLADVGLTFENGAQQVLLNGENVNDQIRTEEVGTVSSKIAPYPVVREKLLSLQREAAEKYDVIMDGRDIGTQVLPDAEIKIFLTADLSVRAKRRYLELQSKNIPCSMEEVESDMKKRDERDVNRELSPLRKAEDAVTLDTSDLSVGEVTDRIVEIVENYQKNRKV